MHDALIEGMKQLGDGGLVIMQRLFAATVHVLSGEKHFQQLGVVQNGQKGLFDFRNKKLLHVGTLLLLVGCTNIPHR